MVVVICCVLSVRCWLSVVVGSCRCWLLVVGCRLLLISFRVFVVQLLFVQCSSFVVNSGSLVFVFLLVLCPLLVVG